MTKQQEVGVQQHFDKVSAAFASIYDGKQKSFLYKTVDVLFRRRILEERLRTVLDYCGDLNQKSVLDVGCGPGLYSVLMAQSGASHVLGLDISPIMLKMAQNRAEELKITNKCTFEEGEFREKIFLDTFDVLIATGFFDYIADPLPTLRKMASLIRGKAVLTFPVKWSLMTPIRKAWLYKRRCFNRYYTESGIRSLANQAGLKIENIKTVGSVLVPGNYIVECKKA